MLKIITPNKTKRLLNNLKSFLSKGLYEVSDIGYKQLRKETRIITQELIDDLLADRLDLAGLAPSTIEKKRRLMALGFIRGGVTVPLVRFKNIANNIYIKEENTGRLSKSISIEIRDVEYNDPTSRKNNIRLPKLVEMHAQGRIKGGIKRDIFKKLRQPSKYARISSNINNKIMQYLERRLKQ